MKTNSMKLETSENAMKLVTKISMGMENRKVTYYIGRVAAIP